MTQLQIGVLGAGNMGSAIMRGLLKARHVEPGAVCASDVSEARLAELNRELGIATTTSNRQLLERSDVVLLAVKPQMVGPVMSEVGAAWRSSQLLVSILAGVSTEVLQSSLPASARVIRTMPNTPAMVLEAATGVARGANATAEDVATALGMFGCIGVAVEVAESMLDAVTGLSGSGPAFVLLALEAMADGAVRVGMPRAMALQLAAQTMAGTARMVLQTGEHPAVLKDRVTSPAGTTIAGLMELEKASARHAFSSAVARAAERSAELGRASRK